MDPCFIFGLFFSRNAALLTSKMPSTGSKIEALIPWLESIEGQTPCPFSTLKLPGQQFFLAGCRTRPFLFFFFVLFSPPYRLHLIKNKNTKHYRHHQKERSFQVAGRLYMSDWEDCSLSSSWSLRRRLTFKQSVSVAQFISRSASLSINLSGDVDGSVGIISPRRMFPIQSFSAQPGKSAEEKSFESKKHDLIKRRFVYSFYLFYLLQSLYSLESRDTLR